MSDPTAFNTPPRAIFTSAQVDDLAQALLTLTRELWVVKDRQRVLEAVLAERGIDVTAAIESHTPSPALEAELAAEGKRLVGAVIAALGVTPPAR
jgi:hypothetical protein